MGDIMRRITLASLLVVLLLGAVVACAEDGLGVGEVVAAGVPTKGAVSGAVDEELSSAITDFGIDLLKRSGEDAPTGTNTVVSPLSVHTALTMAYNGAAGTTAEEMEAVLGVGDLGTEDTNAAYANLLTSLNALGQDGPTTLEVANSLWADDGFALRPEFAATDREYFGAQLEVLDLQTDGAKRINGWVADQTNDRITDLIDEVPGNAALYLVNAVYMKGEWEEPFPSEATTLGPFAVGSDQIDVPMMSRGGEMLYAEANGGTQAVRLPYKDRRLGMWIVKPPLYRMPGSSVEYWLDGLDAETWTAITGSAAFRAGSLTMPKFTTRTKTELAGALSDMGMPAAFDMKKADFSGIYTGNDPLWISRVLHQTYVSVDETGTEAAAATAVEALWGAVPMPPEEEPFKMLVNRPFLFAIEDTDTGALLFLGRIEDPR